MSQALCFNEITFSPVNRQNSPWIRAVELSKALGFKREDQAAKIYRAHADEFTSDTAQVVEISDNADSAFPVKSLLFSLRGCHLLAMFARTPVAKQFRRWVLDVIEQYGDQVPVTEPAASSNQPTSSIVSVTPSSVADRKPLRSLVNAWARLSGHPFGACWNQVKAAFRLTDIRDLPQEWIPDAIAWVQAKIDALPKAFPSAPLIAPSSSTEPKTETGIAPDLPADMDSGRKDALKRIQRLTWGVHAAHDVLLLSVNPKWNRAARHNIPFEIALNLFRSAEANLVAAYNDLEAGYRLSQQFARG